MLTGATLLLTLLFMEYDTLYVHTQTITLLNNHIRRILCGPRYAHRDVWEMLVHLFSRCNLCYMYIWLDAEE